MVTGTFTRMACQLSHKLPWGMIDELAALIPESDARAATETIHHKIRISGARAKKLGHFSRCLVSALKEFAATDKMTKEEKEFFNPYRWSVQREHCAPAWPGFYETLPVGYVILNVILMDPERFERQCREGTLPNTEEEYLTLLLGLQDGHHPGKFADHLGQVFSQPPDPLSIKPLTPERLEIIKCHAGWRFRSIYSIGEDNYLLDPEAMERTLKTWYFEWR